MNRPLRIAGQPAEEWSDATREAFGGLAPAAGGARPLHLPSVVARHPTLLGPYLQWARAVALDGVLTRRENALLALRTACNCRSEFEWGVHARTAADRLGFTPDELDRVAAGPDAPGWDPEEEALLRAADELHGHSSVSDATWLALSARHDGAALLEVVFVVGHYTMLSMVANSAGVPPEPDWAPLPGGPGTVGGR